MIILTLMIIKLLHTIQIIKSNVTYNMKTHTQTNVTLYCILNVYTLCLKNIPDIFDCNLKNNYQILIILVQIFPTQLAIKKPFSFPPHPMYVFALLRETRSSEICLEINRKPEKTSPTLPIVT